MELLATQGLALLLLFLVPITLGSLPLCLPFFPFAKKRVQHIYTRGFFSYLNCFAGGFFLGTCLLVVLGQGMSQFENYKRLVGLQDTFPFFQVGIGVGFFLVALTEKLIYIACVHRSKRAKKEEEEARKVQDMTRRSSTTMNESDDDLYEIPDNSDAASTKTILSLSDLMRGRKCRNKALDESERNSKSPVSNHVSHASDEAEGATHDAETSCDEGKDGHGGGRTSSSKEDEGGSEFSLLRVLLLVLALSFHTIFDGLALGLLTEVSQVTTLMAALLIHKAIMSFVLGVELATVFNERKLFPPILALFLYSLASPLGVVVGIGVTSANLHKQSELLTGAVLQAVATGVFLYVTCFEILARDMVDRQDRSLLRVMTAILGFVVLTGLETAVAFGD